LLWQSERVTFFEFLTIGAYVHDLKHAGEFQENFKMSTLIGIIAGALLGMLRVLPGQHFSASGLAATLLYFWLEITINLFRNLFNDRVELVLLQTRNCSFGLNVIPNA
jgi:hypothetical protein